MEKSQVDYSLGFVLGGECYELHKHPTTYFYEDYLPQQLNFKECFKDKNGVRVQNRKKSGALIAKSKFQKT